MSLELLYLREKLSRTQKVIQDPQPSDSIFVQQLEQVFIEQEEPSEELKHLYFNSELSIDSNPEYEDPHPS